MRHLPKRGVADTYRDIPCGRGNHFLRYSSSIGKIATVASPPLQFFSPRSSIDQLIVSSEYFIQIIFQGMFPGDGENIPSIPDAIVGIIVPAKDVIVYA